VASFTSSSNSAPAVVALARHTTKPAALKCGSRLTVHRGRHAPAAPKDCSSETTRGSPAMVMKRMERESIHKEPCIG
jgi:hypothetical protein